MNFLSWNCRGLGNSRAVRVLRDLVKTRKPDFLFLSETRVYSNKIMELSSSFGFANNYVVDCIGRAGGLAIMWMNTVSCSINRSSMNYIDVDIIDNLVPSWKLTCFYGMPERVRRRKSWDLLRHLSSMSQLPWCIFGDFNDLFFQSDKEGIHDHPQYLMNDFRECITDCELMEMVYSDHDPIHLDLFNDKLSKKEFRFRFENTWLKEPSFRGDVQMQWDNLPRMQLMPKLLSISSFMAKWGRNFVHKFREKLGKQKSIVNALADKTDSESIHNYFLERDKPSQQMVDANVIGVVTEDQNGMLVSDLTFEEFTKAVKQMHPDKSSGPDVGSSKYSVFKFLKDRIWKRIHGWNAKLLSKADKAVLLKSVATAIPSYCMTCFMLPKKLCQEIERILNGFWWSSSSSVMLGKHVWNFVHKPQSLVSRVFKAKYYPNSHILNASSNEGASFIWSGIFKAKEELEKGFKWILGNGKDILVISDPWLRGKEDFMIDNGDDFDVNMKVNQLFHHNSAEWDREKIYDMFNERDANAILNLIIPKLDA
ncbi:uncharacterized protein LOC141691818 [Apium graveolens]|uniref:uncharacterized protein LOC141691818 n=1 Tax=Apium graveolens TaxID=4045 RepID=UPI003D79F49C